MSRRSVLARSTSSPSTNNVANKEEAKRVDSSFVKRSTTTLLEAPNGTAVRGMPHTPVRRSSLSRLEPDTGLHPQTPKTPSKTTAKRSSKRDVSRKSTLQHAGDVTVAAPVRHFIVISLRSLSGELIAEVRVQSHETVQYLREVAQKHVGGLAAGIRLVLQHEVLEDDSLTLDKVGALDGETVFVMKVPLPIIATTGGARAYLWNAETGQCIHTLQGHAEIVLSATFSPDRQNILTCSGDSRAKMWDAETGKCVQTFAGHTASVRDAAFSADGGLLVTASNDLTARIWNSRTGECKQVLAGHIACLRCVAFSPVVTESDGATRVAVATGSEDRTVMLWCLKAEHPVHQFNAHTAVVLATDFSPDGKHLLTASGDKTARLWNLASGECIRVISGHNKMVRSGVFSPCGEFIATASDDMAACIWKVSDGAPVRRFLGHTDLLVGVRFSLDGRFLATGSCDKTARVWHIASGKCIMTLTHKADLVSSVAL